MNCRRSVGYRPASSVQLASESSAAASPGNRQTHSSAASAEPLGCVRRPPESDVEEDHRDASGSRGEVRGETEGVVVKVGKRAEELRVAFDGKTKRGAIAAANNADESLPSSQPRKADSPFAGTTEQLSDSSAQPLRSYLEKPIRSRFDGMGELHDRRLGSRRLRPTPGHRLSQRASSRGKERMTSGTGRRRGGIARPRAKSLWGPSEPRGRERVSPRFEHLRSRPEMCPSPRSGRARREQERDPAQTGWINGRGTRRVPIANPEERAARGRNYAKHPTTRALSRSRWSTGTVARPATMHLPIVASRALVLIGKQPSQTRLACRR